MGNPMKSLIKRIVRFLIQLIVENYSEITIRENINTVRWRRAVIESVNFIENEAVEAQVFSNKKELLQWALDRITGEGMILEFGVYFGDSLNTIGKYFNKNKAQREIFGFDAFQGLEEDWVGHRWGKGAFSTGGQLPVVEKNCKLVVGWIQDTLPTFIKDQDDVTPAFIHIDTDTYTPAAYILRTLKSRIKKGTLILFDDFFGYPGWQHGEYKALNETIDKQHYKFIGFSNNQALIEIL